MSLETHRERGEFELAVRARRGLQHFVLDYHPFDVVGWDGYVYPYSFNIHDFEPKSGRLHQPPTVHQTFQGPNFVICSFCPRQLDWDPLAVPIPYHHSNLQSEEVIYYVDGQFGSRAGVGAGALTLHPSGLPHGPQPGRVEASLGATHTDELAVMCDTFRPLRLTTLARDLDDPSVRAELARGGAGAGGLTRSAAARRAQMAMTRRVRISHRCASFRPCVARSARSSAAVCVTALEHVAPRERRGGASAGGGCCRSRSRSGCRGSGSCAARWSGRGAASGSRPCRRR